MTTGHPIKRFKNRYRVLLIIILGGLLYYAYHYWKYTPQRNPHPQYFMTVSGNVDPSLRDKVHLKWTATYSTTKRACDKTYNHFEGVVGWRWITRTFTTQVDHTGHYQLRIPLDHYKPGYCGWKIASINDCSGIGPGCDGITEFYPCGNSILCEVTTSEPSSKNVVTHTAHYINVCKQQRNGQWHCPPQDSSNNLSNSSFIPRKQNYQFIETFQISSTSANKNKHKQTQTLSPTHHTRSH